MDPIADLLTRVRNAAMKRKERVDIPFSKMKLEIVRVLKDEGYIANYKEIPAAEGKPRGTVRVFLKYSEGNDGLIGGLKRISRPGCRIYRSYLDIPKVRGPFGISILSTSKGVMSDADAKANKVGGEVLCQVW
ncbi:MAG: 30S ribosomal protein S8 [Elusimicrobiaceae bacterium]|nr:30S ribosomal protein S8 [Elusimicrobiaceae bacterium]